MSHTKKSWYRPDIDGLRALAIIPVVLFHADIAGFSGGFVGVDIFFVISGFLITSILLRELKEERFSLTTFFERRLRRIVPALTVMIMGVLAAGYVIVLFPIDYIDMGQSALAQAVFLANVFFFRQNDYFTESAELMPFLHTWSLSVEEQFYIVFPILLLLLWRFAKKLLLPAVLLIALTSIFLSYYWSGVIGSNGFDLPLIPAIWNGATFSEAAFYLLPTRAFELMVGALIAIGGWRLSHQKLAEGVGLLGLGACIYAIVFFSESTTWPGLAALVPTLGAGALIVANTGNRTAAGSLLAFPIFVWVGLISYSLYLWHWPVFVLAKHHWQRLELTTLETSGLIVLSFLLAYTSYRLVETPFRDKYWLTKQWQMYVGGIGALITTVAVGAYIAANNGLPERAPGAARAVATAVTDFGPRRSECFVNSFSGTDEPCYLGERDEEDISFVVWGDSHAAALLPAIDAVAVSEEKSGASFIAAGCQAGKADLPGSNPKCERVETLFWNFIDSSKAKKVLLIGRWPHTEDDPETLAFQTALTDRVQRLTAAGVEVFLLAQVPAHPDFLVKPFFYAATHPNFNPQNVSVSLTQHEARQNSTQTLFLALAENLLVHIIDPAETLCSLETGQCYLYQDDVLLYQDADHLNATGALLLSLQLQQEFFQR